MEIKENIRLAPYTTFKIGGPARYFCTVTDEDEVVEAVRFAKKNELRFFVLGGGSNILVSDSGFDGLVIKNEIVGKKFSDQTTGQGIGGENGRKINGESVVISEPVSLAVGGGYDWEKLVRETVEDGLYGLENLSAIPGTVGAAPVQNIGAYGADASNAIHSVHAYDVDAGDFVEFSNKECRFGYRDSLFKQKKGKYIITTVTFVLSRNGRVNIGYKDLKDYFSEKNNSSPSLKEVRAAVVEIRKNKLPDWRHWGTAGSFFKNPIIAKKEFEVLKAKYPGLPGFVEPDGRVKISLGWILDKVCDFRGLTVGNVGTYEKQALVLVTRPGATAREVVDFAVNVMDRVKEKTGITIEGEVDWSVA